MATELLTPILTGIKNINYFEGRLLTARDLREQEEANREHRWNLGKAIGAGVVEGLQVSVEGDGAGETVPVVKVTAGVAINANGQVLEVEGDGNKIALSKTQEEPEFEGDVFRICAGPPDTRQIPNGSGLYLLIISPTAIYQEFAPKSGLLAAGDSPECGRRYVAEGIQFRLEQVQTSKFDEVEVPRTALETLTDEASDVDIFKAVSLLRNGIAHSFFKSVAADGVSSRIRGVEPQAFTKSYSAFDQLTDSQQLTDCDVPLALLYWDQKGIRFLDSWAVRRLARWLPQTHDFSLIRDHGLERFLQFQDQIDDLLDSGLVLEQFSIEDLFRTIPPAAYIPVNGANSAQGFDRRDFADSVFRPPINTISAGLFTDVLKKSLHLPAIDLKDPAYLHLFELSENELALGNDDSSQRYYIYSGNDVSDSRIEDGLVVAFETAWSVYGGLLKRRIFLPPATSEERIVALTSITTSVRNVMDMANRQASIAASNVLNYRSALKAYRWLYDAQAELAQYLQSSIPGIIDTQDREAFGAELEKLLDVSLDNGAPGLDTALQNADLVAAIDAQNAINSFVGSWSGEGIALGPFFISYSNSPEGTVLVPGADPIPQVFTLFNGTDKTLTFDLQAELEPVAIYTQPMILNEVGGGEIDSMTLVSGARARVVAMVAAPLDGVTVGDRPNLIMTASAPAPTNRNSPHPFPNLLVVGDTQGDETEGLITFLDVPPNFIPIHAGVPAIDPENIIMDQAFSIVLNATYENENTTPRTFTVEIAVTADSDIAGWIFATPINFSDVEENIIDTRSRIYSYERENQTPGSLPFTIGVGAMAQTAGATDLTINFSIRSTDAEPPVSAEYGGIISLSMA